MNGEDDPRVKHTQIPWGTCLGAAEGSTSTPSQLWTLRRAAKAKSALIETLPEHRPGKRG